MNHSPQQLVTWFRDLGINDRPTVGGKGASLGELTRAGIRVPPGFVVTTAAFEEYLGAVDTVGSIRAAVAKLAAADHAAIGEASKRAIRIIREAAMPTELGAAITSAYSSLCGDKDKLPVAVRSSATSEDSEEASFAGLQDTYLWVRGDDAVLAAVRDCWSSLYSVESITYRRRLDLPEASLSMGVVVQQMVDSLCSGVMFTRSPTTGDRSVVTLESSWGLGSSIVSGEVTPDRYVINKVTGEIKERTVAIKALQHVPSPRGGIVVEDLPAEKQGIPCLFDEQITELVTIAKQVERHYGCPQDIEWAIARDLQAGPGTYLLQSRPETVWAAKEVKPVAKPAARAFDHVFSVLGGNRKS